MDEKNKRGGFVSGKKNMSKKAMCVNNYFKILLITVFVKNFDKTFIPAKHLQFKALSGV